MDQASQIAALQTENAALREQIASLEEKVLLLMQRLEGKAVKKDSHNSHNPPSQDKGSKKSRSLRGKSSRKSGGQPGHPGRTLEMVAVADVIEALQSSYCQVCGSALPEQQSVISVRQVVDIPPVQPVYTEYRQMGCACPACAHFQQASYPEQVKAPIQYGGSVEALVAYLSVYQYLPYHRLCALLKDAFGLSMSEGSVYNLLERAARKASPVYETIQQEIQQAAYVGSDETGAKVNGQSWWVWCWQNANNTFLKASACRGSQTIEETFPLGLPKATIGSDRWAAQLKTTAKAKQLCLAHLQRDLIYLQEKEQHPFATQCQHLFQETLQLGKQAQERAKAWSREEQQVQQVEDQLNGLLIQTIDGEQHPETLTFQKSMIKHRDALLVFLYDLEVPPDNNGSERAIRNVKVKQKVSGQFKTAQHTFCILRSVIDTLKKRDLDIFAHLAQIMVTPAPT